MTTKFTFYEFVTLKEDMSIDPVQGIISGIRIGSEPFDNYCEEDTSYYVRPYGVPIGLWYPSSQLRKVITTSNGREMTFNQSLTGNTPQLNKGVGNDRLERK
jgi:hypothetical protein